MLGIESEFDGLHITPCVPSNWNEYSVKRLYRDKEYRLSFRRAADNEKKGIYTNEGIYVHNSIIPVGREGGDYTVLY